MIPIAVNLHVITLDELCFCFPEPLALVIQLLQKSPKLSQLEVETAHESWSRDYCPSILEKRDTWFSDQHLCKLKTLQVKEFRGSRTQMHLIKIILSASPALEEVVIMKSKNYPLDLSEALEITTKMIRSPRASPKAQVIILDTK
ncbi:unnamed protein product [Cuscuta epithymum]|uniref:FBD domain-containing protein n=1 Tax=Cuscuta epithymum TaxID=186058 RepID=A0AAV0GJH1_9ASTE|nr:unnamed protein product [Cuscuta epithymum]CAH9148056.1 unnamed protein product [Cuscuta epithymum]